MTAFIHWNGSIIAQEDFRISPDSRGLRYGDGLFETMKADAGKIFLDELHFDRFFSSLKILRFDIPSSLTPDYLREQIKLLLKANGLMNLARVRLMAIRSELQNAEQLTDHPQILIQSWPIASETIKMKADKFRIDIFPDARKSFDLYSGIKSNNYLCYTMGAAFANIRGLNDAIILNADGRIADATIASVFIIKDGLIITPPLSEGGVNGVFRRHLLQSFAKDNTAFREAPLDIEDLMTADEIFLTNAIRGIYAVDEFRTINYRNQITTTLQKRYSV